MSAEVVSSLSSLIPDSQVDRDIGEFRENALDPDSTEEKVVAALQSLASLREWDEVRFLRTVVQEERLIKAIEQMDPLPSAFVQVALVGEVRSEETALPVFLAGLDLMEVQAHAKQAVRVFLAAGKRGFPEGLKGEKLDFCMQTLDIDWEEKNEEMTKLLKLGPSKEIAERMKGSESMAVVGNAFLDFCEKRGLKDLNVLIEKLGWRQDEIEELLDFPFPQEGGERREYDEKEYHFNGKLLRAIVDKGNVEFADGKKAVLSFTPGRTQEGVFVTPEGNCFFVGSHSEKCHLICWSHETGEMTGRYAKSFKLELVGEWVYDQHKYYNVAGKSSRRRPENS